jgi:aspartate carbamoyltransferase catalytic subunit
MPFKRKALLGIRELKAHEMEHIIEMAASLKEINTRSIKKVLTLGGKTVVHLFHELSTRTRTSLGVAAKRLSADTFSITMILKGGRCRTPGYCVPKAATARFTGGR